MPPDPSATYLFVVILLVFFNGTIVIMLRSTLRGMDIQSAVREKGLASAPATPQDAGTSPPDTSYSRVTGMLGAIVLTAFFWALGNIILYDLVYDPNGVKAVVDNTYRYILSGAALFAPYTVNQLSSIFR